MITDYYWILLTANPVRYADIRPCNGFAGETIFCLSQELPGAEGAARAEPSLLELCRVASEEDDVNIPERFLIVTGHS